MRSEITLLLLCGLSLVSAGCDRPSGGSGQAAGEGNGALAGPTPDEVQPTEDKAVPARTIDRSHKGAEAPDMVFSGPDGEDVSLADFAGKPLLVNLWATWCGPCIEEMPTLDQVAQDHAKAGLVVLTVSQDTGEAASVTAFFQKHDLPRLKAYRDPENQLGFHYSTGLLPTTVLYDRDGKEVARVIGAMDWTGPDADALIEEAIN